MPGPLLIVEDDADLAENLQEIIGDAGIPNHVASSGERAFELALRGGHCGVLSDVRLPGCSGVTLLQRLRAAGSSLPVVLMSAFLDANGRRDAEEAGALEILGKPLDFARLLALAGECYRPSYRVLVLSSDAQGPAIRAALEAAGIPTLLTTPDCALSLGRIPAVAVISAELLDAAGAQTVRRLFARLPGVQGLFLGEGRELRGEALALCSRWDDGGPRLLPAQPARVVEGVLALLAEGDPR